jgi:hypothetical protein
LPRSDFVNDQAKQENPDDERNPEDFLAQRFISEKTSLYTEMKPGSIAGLTPLDNAITAGRHD